MAELKTKKTDASVTDFIDAVSDETRRKDCRALVKMMKDATKARPRMWGPSIVGFGEYHYKYASGREGDWPIVGFSPRKQDLTLYIMPGFEGIEGLMGRLGRHRTGKCCLYIKGLSDVDTGVLGEIVRRSVKAMKSRKPHG